MKINKMKITMILTQSKMIKKKKMNFKLSKKKIILLNKVK